MRACVRACVRARMCVCVYVRARARARARVSACLDSQVRWPCQNNAMLNASGVGGIPIHIFAIAV